MNRRLYRSTTDSILGGVAGGVADYLDADPAIVRIVWAILAVVTGGIFVVLYVVMWIVVPEGEQPAMTAGAAEAPAAESAGGGSVASGTAEPGSPAHSAPIAPTGTPAARHVRRRGSGNGGLIFGLILIGIGAYFLVRQYVSINMDRLWPIGLVLLGVLLLVVAMRRSPE
jgi:phage shock protein PspC (stress-responsive transcriptional regulator)